MNLVYMLVTNLCDEQAIINVTYLIGIVIFGIKVAVPIILIVVGMVDLLQAISKEGGDDALKKAQSGLVKKAVGAVVIFLIATIVGLLMGLIGGTQYQACMQCINSPFKDCAQDLTNNRLNQAN